MSMPLSGKSLLRQFWGNPWSTGRRVAEKGSGKTRGRPAMGVIHRLAVVGAVAIAPLVYVTVNSPAVSSAIECGWGTVFDPPSNTCVADRCRRHHRRLRRLGTVIRRRTSRSASATHSVRVAVHRYLGSCLLTYKSVAIAAIVRLVTKAEVRATAVTNVKTWLPMRAL